MSAALSLGLSIRNFPLEKCSRCGTDKDGPRRGQERQLQSEADVYAINREGDLVIFELKRGLAGEDAVLQAIGYTQRAGPLGLLGA